MFSDYHQHQLYQPHQTLPQHQSYHCSTFYKFHQLQPLVEVQAVTPSDTHHISLIQPDHIKTKHPPFSFGNVIDITSVEALGIGLASSVRYP